MGITANAQNIEKPTIEGKTSFAVVVDQTTLEKCRAEIDGYKVTELGSAFDENKKNGGSYFAREGRVDPVSLACTFKGNEDERIEMCIEELLEEL